MIVALTSHDQRLHEVCEEILTESSPEDHHVLTLAPGAPLPHADVHIWDCWPGKDAALRLIAEAPHRHIFLIDRNDLTGAEAELSGAMLVLKPVTKSSLGAWMAQAGAFRHQQIRNPKSRMLAAAAEANLKLQESDRDRNRFLGRIVHDLRAPLTSANGYCGLLLAEELGPLNDIQKEVLDRTRN